MHDIEIASVREGKETGRSGGGVPYTSIVLHDRVMMSACLEK